MILVVIIGDKMEKYKKWQTFEISLERLFIEKETQKAYLFKFEIGLFEDYRFWYPKVLVNKMRESVVISYQNNNEFPRKVFLNKKKELILSMPNLIELLDKASLNFYDNIERLETYIPEKIFKEVEIDEELLA
ncbi:hypothetical protein HMPREF3221_01713 [Fusobacterium nucleatum]|jgi:hypothetical protein|uniref:Uncharacterized protein n=2 Tax=Fusobacterium nucleatum TaxID=851 RepID=A0A133NQU9_FUSNU|nr:hypothetical protein HMPREF3221_01713 [Fusobacterium nucleatum]